MQMMGLDVSSWITSTPSTKYCPQLSLGAHMLQALASVLVFAAWAPVLVVASAGAPKWLPQVPLSDSSLRVVGSLSFSLIPVLVF